MMCSSIFFVTYLSVHDEKCDDWKLPTAYSSFVIYLYIVHTVHPFRLGYWISIETPSPEIKCKGDTNVCMKNCLCVCLGSKRCFLHFFFIKVDANSTKNIETENRKKKFYCRAFGVMLFFFQFFIDLWPVWETLINELEKINFFLYKLVTKSPTGKNRQLYKVPLRKCSYDWLCQSYWLEFYWIGITMMGLLKSSSKCLCRVEVEIEN